MRIVIYGAGAIGGLVGAHLAAHHEVLLVARPAVAAAVRFRGLVVHGSGEIVAHPAVTTELRPGTSADLVIVTTKAYDTEGAAHALGTAGIAAPVMSLQNGLGNAEALAAKLPHVLAGTTSHGVTIRAPGELVHAGTGETVVGPFQGVEGSLADGIAGVLSDAGLPTRAVVDIRSELWRKAVINTAINPIAGLVRRPNGFLLESPPLRDLALGVLRESTAVAQAEGHAFDPVAVEEQWRRVVTSTAANRNSMLQDLEAKRRTEVDAINGAVVRTGARHGLPTPMNRVLWRLVEALEGGPRGTAAF